MNRRKKNRCVGAPKECATGKMWILIKQKPAYRDPSKVQPPVSYAIADCINRDTARKREVITPPTPVPYEPPLSCSFTHSLIQ